MSNGLHTGPEASSQAAFGIAALRDSSTSVGTADERQEGFCTVTDKRQRAPKTKGEPTRNAPFNLRDSGNRCSLVHTGTSKPAAQARSFQPSSKEMPNSGLFGEPTLLAPRFVRPREAPMENNLPSRPLTNGRPSVIHHFAPASKLATVDNIGDQDKLPSLQPVQPKEALSSRAAAASKLTNGQWPTGCLTLTANGQHRYEKMP